MASGKFTIYSMTIVLVIVVVIQMTSAEISVLTPAATPSVNGTLANIPIAVGVVPEVAKNAHVNATAAHLTVRRKGFGGVGGAVAGGLASGAAMTAIGGILG